VPFTLVHVGKYRTKDQLKIQTIQKLYTTHKSKHRKNTAKQNYPGSVASYNTQPGNEVGLFYNALEHIWGDGPRNVTLFMLKFMLH